MATQTAGSTDRIDSTTFRPEFKKLAASSVKRKNWVMNPNVAKRSRNLLGLGALAVIGCVAWFHLFLQRPVGSGPAGPSVPVAAFSKSWSDRPTLLMGFGDSVTAGFGASKNHSYFDRLVRNPENEFAEMQGISLSAVFPNLKATNLAVSGSTSLQHVKLQASKLEKQPVEIHGIVVLTTGGNDIIHNYGKTPPREGAMYGATLAQAQPWLENFAQRLDEILLKFQETFPGGCDVFLADIYDPTDGLGDAEKAGLPAGKTAPRFCLLTIESSTTPQRSTRSSIS